MIMDIGPKLLSKLGSPESKIPLGVKDSFNSGGYAYFSYEAGGSVECKDRFVDEVGTFAIWMWGLPFYKEIVDNTLFSKLNISPRVDVRVAKDNEYLKEAIKNAPTDSISLELKQAGSQLGKTKALNIAKFGIAMVMTMLSYLGLTKLKQKMTKLNIEKEFNEKMKMNSNNEKCRYQDTIYPCIKSEVFNDFNQVAIGAKQKNNPSFGSLKMAEEFMLNPVKNMILLDIGISGERLLHSRTDGEFKEYAIKEGSFFFFTYCADRLIKKGLEYISKNVLNLPIALDAKFLASNLSSDILSNKELQNQVKDFNKTFTKNDNTTELYKFIFNNQNNAVVEAAKDSGIIATLKDTRTIDPRKYIDPDKMKQLGANLQHYIEAGRNSGDISKYIKRIRGLKIGATFLSIGACCLSLGYLVPKFLYQQYRNKYQDGNSNFHVKTAYEKELAAKSGQKIS